jgi:hypothetical protein
VPAQTPAERRATVDGRLDASLDAFDAALRREQQQTAGQRDARAAGRADGSAVEDVERGRESTGELNRDRSGDLRSEGTADASRGEQAGEKQGDASQRASGAASTPIPSGEDDDIIARRLRKAAEAETDPELKEKLWKEYRDYKENTRGGG